MKKKETFEKNIEKLMKLTSKNDQPSEAFVDKLIDDAMDQLKTPQENIKLSTRRNTMKRTFLRKAALAASILVICALGAAIFMPGLQKAKHKSKDVVLRGQARERQLTSRLQESTVRGKITGRLQALDAKYSLDLSAGTIPPMAHGGTAVPNGQAYDAMFFKNYGVNPFIDTEDDHLSTFATDVDTGSYTLARTYLQRGNIPPNEAIRVEEFVNYFDYDYPAPEGETFAIYSEACPWQLSPNRNNTYLLRLGLKGAEISDENRKPANLTFVIDVSGSMGRENRLGLVKRSLRMLVDNLKEGDTIGIAVYGSRGQVVLEHTGVDRKRKIISAIESLHTNGSTNAEEGIRIGYDMAEKVFEKGMINRVILCSDGVANVGRTGHEEIFKQIKDKADKGITLSALGFGMGNYNDVLMEQLGNKGNGYYSYIDNIEQAKRLFVENLTGTLQVIARDVKLQVDFNPEVVRSYRLIGYENRDVADDKFRDDKEDGGEMGAGHSTTAMYELKLWPGKQGPVATTYIRYKDPESMEATEFNSAFSTADIKDSIEQTSKEFKLAVTVTEFAEILRKSHWAKDANLDATLEKAYSLLPKFKKNSDVIELTDLIAKAAPGVDRAIAVANKSQTNELIPLALVLPRAVAGGTERQVRVENLQQVPESRRPVFYVPAGTTNVALGKPVSGSDENPIGGTLAKITDGDKQGTDGSFIEMGLFDQHVTIDLGEKCNIYAVVAWHYFAQTRVYYDVVVQVADDPDFTDNVVTLFNNDMDNSLGLGIGNDKHYAETLYGKLIDAKGAQARYFRMYSNGNDVNELNHYIEIEVYGKPIKK